MTKSNEIGNHISVDKTGENILSAFRANLTIYDKQENATQVQVFKDDNIFAECEYESEGSSESSDEQ